MIRSALVLLGAIAAHGCSWYVYDATNRPVASNIAGRCFALRQDAILAEHFSYYTAYMLSAPGANDCTPQYVTPATRDDPRYKASGLNYPQCTWVPVANVAKGTQFRVTTVTEQTYGGPGRCWKIDVTFITGANAGIKSGIPACRFDFADPELWVSMRPDHEYVEPLVLSDRLVRPCEE